MKCLGKYGMVLVVVAWAALGVGCVAGGGALPGGSEGDKQYRRLFEHSEDARERRTSRGAKGMSSGEPQEPQQYRIFEHSRDAREFRYQYQR